MIGTKFSLYANEKGVLVQFITKDRKAAENVRQAVTQNEEMEVIIRKKRKRRSLDANAYLWVLCDKIAQKLLSTKEEVYRKLIHDVGVFDYIAVVNKAVEKFVSNWQSKGIGWIAEVEESKLEGCKKVCVYYGSSTYDTKEMSRVIDEAVHYAKSMGIETMTPDEIEELKQKWGATAQNS